MIFLAACRALAPLILLHPLSQSRPQKSFCSFSDALARCERWHLLRTVTHSMPFSQRQASHACSFLRACINFLKGPDFSRCYNLSEQRTVLLGS